MAEQSLKDKTVIGILWSSVERFSVQGVGFIVTLFTARILSPSDYGLVGMLAIFMAVAQTLIDSGFSQALIRKQDRTEVDNSTVFYFNIIVSLLLYLLLYSIAPRVAVFYNEPQLTLLMRVLCLGVVINSLAVVQRAIYTTQIDFRTQAKASLIAAVISGVAGVWMAFNGYGVWTLVWQNLINAGINTLLLWTFSCWHPICAFSWKSFRELFAFGSKLLMSALLDTIYTNMYALVIGKVFSAASLGNYAQADRFAKLPSSNMTGILQRVTYPVLCTLQNDDERLRENYRNFLRLSAFVIFPLMCLLAGVSAPLIELLIGEKWLYASTLLIPVCFTMMWWPIHAINLNLLQVKGRSDLFLRLEVIKKILGVAILVVSIPFGLLVMCYTGILTSILCLIINTYYTGKLISVGFILQMKDISKTLLISLCMFALIKVLMLLLHGIVWQLIIGCVLGALFYFFSTKFLCPQEFSYIKQILKR